MDADLRRATEIRASQLERSMAGYIRHLIREDLAALNDNGPAALDKPGTTTDVHQEDGSAHER